MTLKREGYQTMQWLEVSVMSEYAVIRIQFDSVICIRPLPEIRLTDIAETPTKNCTTVSIQVQKEVHLQLRSDYHKDIQTSINLLQTNTP